MLKANPKSIKKLAEQLCEAVRTDERSMGTSFIKSPLYYNEFGLDPDKGLTLNDIDRIPYVEYRFVSDDLAIVMPVESLHRDDEEQTPYWSLRLPISCKDLETDNPSDISQLILCRQFLAFIVQYSFRFTDPDMQLLLTMDTEARQRTNLQAALMFLPIWKWKDAYKNGTPLRRRIAENYMRLYGKCKLHIVTYYNMANEDEVTRLPKTIDILDIWDTVENGKM